jgi:hypothetical protein
MGGGSLGGGSIFGRVSGVRRRPALRSQTTTIWLARTTKNRLSSSRACLCVAYKGAAGQASAETETAESKGSAEEDARKSRYIPRA